MTFRPPLRLAECRSVTVVARLAHGAVLDSEWPAPLDGILSAVKRRAILGDSYGDGVDLSADQQEFLRQQRSRPGGRRTRVEPGRPGWLSEVDRHRRTVPLPLAVIGWQHFRGDERGPTVGAQWVWAASCAFWDGDERDLRYWHSRFGHQRAEEVCRDKLPPMVYETHGRYRAYRIPMVVTLATELRWRAVGDPDKLAELCRQVYQIGKKRSQGEGRVLGWSVIDEGPPDLTWPLWTPDGRIARPVPVRMAAWLGLDNPPVTSGAIRPPYWRPPPGMDGDAKHRQWRQIIAPGTPRPVHSHA